MCKFHKPGIYVEEVSKITLEKYLLFGLRYVCRHWVSYAEYGRVSLSDDSPVHKVLRQCCPYRIEVMSLTGKIPEAIIMMIQLESLIDVSTMTVSIRDVV